MLELIVNPTAGVGRAGKLVQQIKSILEEKGVPYRMHETTRQWHARDIARDCAERGVERLLSVGGDGTTHEVINGLHGAQTALGIVPAGTGNDFVKVLHMPRDPLECLRLLLEAPACPINICRLNDGVFLNVMGAGFDVDVLRAAARVPWMGRGMLPYLYGVLHAIIHKSTTHMRLVLDGKEEDGDYLIVAVANGQYIGGGMRIAPMAQLDDGWLDVIRVKPVSRLRILKLLPSFINGKYIRETDIVTHTRCKGVEIHGKGLYFQADGLVQPGDDIAISLSDTPLRLLLPEAQQRLAGLAPKHYDHRA